MTLVGRSGSILLGVASVALLYGIARRLFSPRVALVAAAAMATNLHHAERCVLAGNESTMVLLVLVFFLAVLCYVEAPSWRWHAAAGLLLGLATSTKYNAGIQLVTLVAATLLVLVRESRAEERRRPVHRRALQPRFLAGFAAGALAFVAASPWVVVDFGEFLNGFTHQASYMEAGLTESGAAGSLRGWAFYTLRFGPRGNGQPYAVLCALGALLALYRAVRHRESRALLLLTAALPLYLFLSAGETNNMRFLLPATPFVLLLGAWALDAGGGALLRRFPRGERLQDLLLPALAVLLLAPQAVESYQRIWRGYGKTSEERELLLWIRENLDPAEEYLELTSYGAKLLDGRAAIEAYGIREEDLETEAERARFRRHEAAAIGSRHLTELLAASPTFDDLLRRIRKGGYRHLLLSVTVKQLLQLKDLPARVHLEEIRSCTYWEELVQFLTTLERTTPVVGSEYGRVLCLFTLP